MGKINIAIAGVGSCASALLQGIEFYKQEDVEPIGLMPMILADTNREI